MRISSRTNMGHLLDVHPEVESVLSWYQIRLDGTDVQLNIREFCARNNLDMDDLLVEFEAAAEDDEDDDETSTAERRSKP